MNLLKTVFTVSGMTLISRILGFIRDAAIARIFGVSIATDAFWTAFKIPNLLRRTFAEGAFSQAFVPILAEYRKTRTEEETNTLLNHVTGVLGLALLIVTVLGIIAAPFVVWLTATGFANTPAKFDLTVTLLRWLFPYILLISLASLAGSILNAYNKFSVPAFTPTLLNIAMIFATVVVAPYVHPPVLALAFGVMLGGVLQLVYQLPHLAKLGRLPKPVPNFKDPAVRRIMLQMGPAIFAVSISQISLLINTWFASYLENGSVTWLYNADRLMELPTGLLGVALGTVLLPSLSRHAASNNHDEFNALLDWGLRLTLLLALPAAVGLAMLASPLLATLFMGGKYTAHDVFMTQQALVAYSVGLIALILIKVLAPGFYAKQNIKTPVKIGVMVLLGTQLLNILLVSRFHHAGLALAISLGACMNASLLFYNLRKRGDYSPAAGWGMFTVKLGLATLAMAASLWFLRGHFEQWLHIRAWQRAIWLTVCVAGGAGVYFASLYLLGFRVAHFRRRAD
ncbi:murein biosynthesis integral membrane protein MurJ [Leeia oryzae]|uniref:murein biosynthesis integral membrane protein MurJ n=1 Tax=Leeia oryzae TaxID=356662 RepID=UPI0003614BAF|nr:murein biosynthesis integral membrane protein MurJ [Leeia oryzae]